MTKHLGDSFLSAECAASSFDILAKSFQGAFDKDVHHHGDMRVPYTCYILWQGARHDRKPLHISNMIDRFIFAFGWIWWLQIISHLRHDTMFLVGDFGFCWIWYASLRLHNLLLKKRQHEITLEICSNSIRSKLANLLKNLLILSLLHSYRSHWSMHLLAGSLNIEWTLSHISA